MVREAAVDLVGKFILHKAELIDKYYEMLSQRIMVNIIMIILINEFTSGHRGYKLFWTVLQSAVWGNCVIKIFYNNKK